MKKLLLILFVGLLGAGGYAGYFYQKNFIKQNVSLTEDHQFVFIPKDCSQDDLIDLLAFQNILVDSESFAAFAAMKNLKGRNIVPGRYKIENKWTNDDLVNHLRAGRGRLDSRVTFNNVQTIEQLSSKMSTELLLDSTEILQWLQDPVNYSKYGFDEANFLSMFIPNTYFVDVDIEVDQLMKRMAKEYKKFWNDTRQRKANSLGMSQSEVVTLASIVYWETKIPKDMPIVAGVYINRIKKGMPLQADPTLVYALKKQGVHVKRVLNKHKLIDSPYNTYKNAGLPPGPILIPPPSYVDAVLNFKKHNYLFFVAKEDFSGESYFSTNYRQHLIYAKRYQSALNKAGIYR